MKLSSPHRLGMFLLVINAVSGCSSGTGGIATTVPVAPTTAVIAPTTVAIGEPGHTPDGAPLRMVDPDALRPDPDGLYRFHIHCGMRYIRSIDGRDWESDEYPYDGVGPFPEELHQAFVDPNEAVSPVVLGSIEITAPDTLVFRVRNSDLAIVYHPTTVAVPGCM